MIKMTAFFLIILFFGRTTLFAQEGDGIRVDQIGYYAHGPKIAIVIGSFRNKGSGSGPAYEDSLFFILSTDLQDTAFTGRLGEIKKSANSSLQTRIADFSAMARMGEYIMTVPGAGRSFPFRIGIGTMRPVVAAALKGYYYQRSAMRLDPAYAGKWNRPAGHPDTNVLIHASAVSNGRMAGASISVGGGWYDAGDYNKYIVNSGVTMGTLLAAYEDFPSFFDTLHTNIPESGNGVPDILNESLYNLRWMLTMQDPSDGGVYNKCTNAAFDGMVMPGVTRTPRYVVQKGTAATLDFAAVMAQAGRILRHFERKLPGFSDSCLSAAVRAWQWAEKNPALVYDQAAMNSLYEPKITTGGYGDRIVKDEWFWAAVELMVSTKSASESGSKAASKAALAAASETGSYAAVIKERINDSMSLPSWSNVHLLGVFTLLRFQKSLPVSIPADERRNMISTLRQALLRMADRYLEGVRTSAFQTVMGGSVHDFVWGSNGIAANEGMLLINAWLQTKDKKYIDHALGNLDYLLGRNATGYCFVTGIGAHSPQHPHHRPSVADGIAEPVPGLLVGGPNPGRQDHGQYDFTEPETAYSDRSTAYASNEIAINWNAPLVYLAAGIDALQYRVGYSTTP
jgi:endoglucanase